VGAVVEALIVTVELPMGVLALVAIVNVTVIGVPETGFTELEGEKLQCAPLGKPLHDNCTVLLNDPKAVA
jgi:hypothetical protein